MMSTTKVCSKCGVEKSVEEFYKLSSKEGYRSPCKGCYKKYSEKRKQQEKIVLESKVCTKCLVKKNMGSFHRDSANRDGYRTICKCCRKEMGTHYRLKNKEAIKKRKNKYYENNKAQVLKNNRLYHENNEEKIKGQQKQYRQKNKKIINKRNRRYCSKRLKNDACFKLRSWVSSTIYGALKRNQGSKQGESVMNYLPYTTLELKEHLEAQFEPWMTWENHGVYTLNGPRVWHIDHIIPQSALPYDSMDHPNFQKCWALENLRPLEAFENMAKSNNITDVDENE